MWDGGGCAPECCAFPGNRWIYAISGQIGNPVFPCWAGSAGSARAAPTIWLEEHPDDHARHAGRNSEAAAFGVEGKLQGFGHPDFGCLDALNDELIPFQLIQCGEFHRIWFAVQNYCGEY